MFAQKSKKPMSVNDLLGTVDARRDEIAALRENRAQVENAPRPLAETLDLLDAELDRIATASVDALRPYRLRERGAAIDLTLTAGLIVAIAREPLRRVLADQISDLEAARPGMSEQDRTARLAELDGQILRAEMAEEGAIRALERQGVSIQRRADLNPLVALAADQALAG